MNTWQMRDDGIAIVNGSVPSLPKFDADLQRIIKNFGPYIAAHAKRTGVPESWIVAFIKAESNGSTTAKGSSGEVGLMQLMSFHWGGRTAEQMTDPDTNIRVGTDLLYRITRSPCIGWDLAKAASAYNCGQSKDGCPKPKSTSVWGICAAADWYIGNILAHSNDAARLGMSPRPTTAAPTSKDPLPRNVTPVEGGGVGLAAIGIGAVAAILLTRK